MKKRIGHDSDRAARLGFFVVILFSGFAVFGQQTSQLPTPKEGHYVSHDFHFKSGER